MDVYRLDNDLYNDRLIEGYSSMIWTERFNESGDFEIELPFVPETADQLNIGSYIGTNVSDRIMVVDTREFYRDEDGRRMVKVSGESLEAILKKRVAWRSNAPGVRGSPYVRRGGIISIINNSIRRAGFSSNETHPAFSGAIDLANTNYTGPKAMFTTAGYPSDTIVDPGDAVIIKENPVSVYDYIVEICKSYNIGFRFYRRPGYNSEYAILMRTYLGRDLTLTQSTSDPVIFSTDMDNLESESLIESVANYYTGVWVADTHDPPGRTYVFLPNFDANADGVLGLEFRYGFLVVDQEEGATASERTAYRIQMGKEFLFSNGPDVVVDGQISNLSQYQYRRDYNLGDRVEVRTSYNYSAHMRVTEQTFIQDAEGYRTYPTLSAEVAVNDDSWMAQPVSRRWDVAEGHWATE